MTSKAALLLLAGCVGAAPPDPGPKSGSSGGTLGGTPVDSILAGNFAPLAGYGQSTAVGKALLVRGTGTPGSTTVQIHLDGLVPSAAYVAHVHALPCASGAGGHYELDPAVAAGMTNEIWLHLDTDEKGSGDASAMAPVRVRGDALSIVVHDPANDAKMLCADLGNTADMPQVAQGALAPFAAAEAMDQSITGTASLTRSPGATTVTLDVAGLTAGTTYMAHVHALPCGVQTAGGHYMLDPLLSPSTQANEIWPDVTPAADGTSSSTLSVALHVARADAQAVVVHRMGATLLKVACADLAAAHQPDLIAQGTGGPLTAAMQRGLGNLVLTGSLIREVAGGSHVVLAVSGLAPSAMYMAHVHARPCAVDSGGGHFEIDASAPAGKANEIWLEVATDAGGNAAATAAVPVIVRPDAQAIVIHDPADNARLGCVDLVSH